MAAGGWRQAGGGRQNTVRTGWVARLGRSGRRCQPLCSAAVGCWLCAGLLTAAGDSHAALPWWAAHTQGRPPAPCLHTHLEELSALLQPCVRLAVALQRQLALHTHTRANMAASSAAWRAADGERQSKGRPASPAVPPASTSRRWQQQAVAAGAWAPHLHCAQVEHDGRLLKMKGCLVSLLLGPAGRAGQGSSSGGRKAGWMSSCGGGGH